MDNRVRNLVITTLLAVAVIVPVWLWMSPPAGPSRSGSIVPERTPTRGEALVAVDKSLLPVMKLQSGTFADHYPDARVSLAPEPSGRTLLRLIDRVAHGAVVDGALTHEEDSVITSMKRPVKREPIARNALVVIVNQANPAASISVAGLKRLFSGELTEWNELGGKPGRIVACVDGSDFRSQAILSSILFGKAGRLKASAADDIGALLRRVSDDPQAIAIVTLPEYARALHSADSGRIKAIPVSRREGDEPVKASPASVYSGEYPLVSIVYYIYDPYDPTATGFGAWLSREGQKFFERGDMAPFSQTVRTIILK
jgi:phosphate transport system substrate-binding protein